MTAINTIEDLVRIMDERPEWVEAMRVRLLTREVLELPQTIAKLAETVEKFIDSTNKRLDSIEARLDQHDARFDQVDTRFDQVDARFDQVDARFDQVDARFDQVDARFEAVDARFDAVDTRFQTVDNSIQKLRDDIAPLKAAHARNAAIDDAIAIASDLGLRRTKNLTRDEVWELTESVDTSGIPTNELRSFRRADLIVEATDKNDEVCYVAVEISFTANGRDTVRAIRNAEYLNRFTGKRTYAAVAGLNRDNRVNEIFESGRAFWYQLDPDHLEVE
jgi:hypothetical protein